MFLKQINTLATYSPGGMGKSTLAQGPYLFAGLNAFEPGQEHAAHSHAGQDKLYLVLEGSGEVRIGDQTRTLSAGDAAFAASGVMHSVRNTGDSRLVVLAVLGPPPSPR
jgi:quercetin dioxygenase-like cupin family protein